MQPTSSPVPRLSSAPSDASTVHTIASRSPLPALLSALRDRDERPPRPLLGDAIATTSPPHRNRATSRRAAPRRSTILPASSSSPSLFLQVVRVGHSKRANEKKRDRTRAKDAAAILASSSPLFRSVCCLTVRTIASGSPSHPVAPSERDGRAPCPALGDVISTTSPPISKQQKRCRPSGLSVILPPLACVLLSAAPSLYSSFSRSSLRTDLFRSLLPDVLPAILPTLSTPAEVVRGRADHQPGQAIPSRSSCRPSPPCRGWRPAPRLAL